MTAQNIMWITIDSCVNDYIIESNKSISDYYRLWQLAFRGMDSLGLTFFYQVKSVKIPVSDNMTVMLPSDFINWSKVGILNESGEIIPLRYNDKLTNYANLWNNRTDVIKGTDDLSNNSTSDYTWVNYWNGSGYVNVYGVPSGSPFAGDFKVDKHNGVIMLNYNYRWDYVMLEYVASPKQGEEYYIPVHFREALIAWLRWKDIQSIPVKTHMENSNVVLRERDFYRQARIAIAQFNPSTIYEKYQVSQENARQAIKT